MFVMKKAEGAFLTISELAEELGLPQHILRYWESRFPQLKPLQRSGNRRYYRPEDVALARRIHHLLNSEGFTVKGAQKMLAERTAPARNSIEKRDEADAVATTDDRGHLNTGEVIDRLEAIRTTLAAALKN